jgi:hypothetical protein
VDKLKQEAKLKLKLIPFTILAAIMIGTLSYFIWIGFSHQKAADYMENWNYTQSEELLPDISLSLPV